MDIEFKKSHVPAFGSWDCNDDLPFTQCFETARQAGLLRYSYSQDRDLYVTGDLYQNDVVTPAMIVVPRRRAKGGYPHVKEGKKEGWVVCECECEYEYDVKEPASPVPPRKAPKAVDEDLYKISPDLLYASSKRIDEAIETYETITKEKFMFIRHWHALRFSPKYQATMDKKNKPGKDKEASSHSVDSQIHISLDSDETMDRPIGRKAAKKLKRAASEAKDDEGLELLKKMQTDSLAIASSRSESIQMSLQLQKEMMQLQKEELQLRLAKEERERQKEERERQIYEGSIMAMDTSKMPPDQAKYYDALKARIMKNVQ